MRHTPAILFAGAAVATSLLLAGSLGGCAATRLTNVWKDPQFSSPPMSKIFVVAMSQDGVVRRLWEDTFDRALAKHDVAATPSYRQFPDALPDTGRMLALVRSEGYDAVLMTMPMPSQKLTRYVPGYVEDIPVTHYSDWYQAYYTYFREVYQPGHTETTTVVRYRSELWSTRGGEALVWTATSEEFDPTSSQAVTDHIEDMIIPELAKQGLIPKSK